MTSKPIVFDDISFTPDEETVLSHLGPAASGSAEDIRALVVDARRAARPRAVCRPCAVSPEGCRIVIGGQSFESSLLLENLKDVPVAYPFVVTCGREIAEWAGGMTDPLLRFWADGISELAMQAARTSLMDHLRSAHGLGKASTMNPGSLAEWPLSQQVPLFRAIGDVEDLIGVTLTESFLMLPVKSVSGIRFPSKTNYENCMLCPREPCARRRAPYNPDLRGGPKKDASHE